MSFIANPAAQNPAPAVADALVGDDWHPALSIAAFRDAMRIGELVSAGRCRAALLGGIVSADVAISAWKAAGSATTLQQACPGAIAGEPKADILYRRAVFAFAAAGLADTHSDISATETGRDRREVRAAGADELRRTATIALRDLMGRGRAKLRLV